MRRLAAVLLLAAALSALSCSDGGHYWFETGGGTFAEDIGKLALVGVLVALVVGGIVAATRKRK